MKIRFLMSVEGASPSRPILAASVFDTLFKVAVDIRNVYGAVVVLFVRWWWLAGFSGACSDKAKNFANSWVRRSGARAGGERVRCPDAPQVSPAGLTLRCICYGVLTTNGGLAHE